MHSPPSLPSPPPLAAARPPLPDRPRPLMFVRVPATAQIEADAGVHEQLQRWVLRELSGWVQLVILDLLATGKLEWQVDASPTIGLATGPGERLLAVRCEDRRGPRRPGLWAVLAVAAALADRYAGVVVDPRRALGLVGARERLRPPASGRVQIIDHLCLPCSRGPTRRRWLTSVGMSQFGLPDLELVEVPDPLVGVAARLLLGVAQHLVDGAWLPPRPGQRPREALVTVGELCWALGGEPGEVPSVRGRGWTRVAVGVAHDRAWPALLRLGPPLGARGSGATGPWLRVAWRELVGDRGDEGFFVGRR